MGVVVAVTTSENTTMSAMRATAAAARAAPAVLMPTGPASSMAAEPSHEIRLAATMKQRSTAAGLRARTRRPTPIPPSRPSASAMTTPHDKGEGLLRYKERQNRTEEEHELNPGVDTCQRRRSRFCAP